MNTTPHTPPAAGKGRPKGALNKRRGAKEACAKLGVNVFEYMAMAVKGDIPCNVCRQKLTTRVAGSGKARQHLRNCQSCKGDGWEKLNPEFRGKMAAELAHYLEPKLQSTALTGADGAPLPSWQVVVKTEK